MIRAEVTIFGNKSEYCHYLENRANDIVSILWKNNVDVTKVTFQAVLPKTECTKIFIKRRIVK